MFIHLSVSGKILQHAIMVLCANLTYSATTFGQNNPSSPSGQLYYSRKNGPKIFLGPMHVHRLIGKCVKFAIFAKKNGTVLITPDITCTPNAGRFNRRQNRKRVTYYFSKIRPARDIVIQCNNTKSPYL